jgi:hypothetical protein
MVIPATESVRSYETSAPMTGGPIRVTGGMAVALWERDNSEECGRSVAAAFAMR